MTRSIVTEYMRNPFLAGACVLVGLAGCSSKDNGTGSVQPPLGTGAVYGAAGTGVVGSPGGTTPVGTTGPMSTGSGGTSTVGGGGTPVGGGGTPGVAGTSTISSGGTTTGTAGATGTAGTSGGGTTGGGGTSMGGATGTAGGGGVKLVDCVQTNETSAMPIMDPCGTFQPTPSYATKLQLGPYGGQMDVNVGKGFENPDPMDSATCPSFAAIFGEDPKITNQLLDVGMQPCTATAPNTGTCLDMKLYSVYHPANWPEGKLPVLTWGNGTCAQPEGYGGLLRYIASFGFVIVAANNREVGTGAPLLKGLDFMAAANMDSSSPYFGHLDMSKVGIMGHSQGSAAAGTAASDPRVKAVILYNGGTSNAKPYLAVSGDMDIGGTPSSGFASALASAAKGSYMYFHNPAGMGGIRGHLVLMMTPQRLDEQSVEFWQMTLNGDMAAHDKFLAQKTSMDYDFGAKGF